MSATDPFQPFANYMTSTSETDIANVLRSLIEENDDSYGRFETIEAYVNANRESALNDANVLTVLGKMRAMGLVGSYHYMPDESKYELVREAAIDGETWFRATELGSNEYHAKYSTIST